MSLSNYRIKVHEDGEVKDTLIIKAANPDGALRLALRKVKWKANMMLSVDNSYTSEQELANSTKGANEEAPEINPYKVHEYIKKPLTVKALQWYGNIEEMARFLGSPVSNELDYNSEDKPAIMIHHDAGDMRCNFGSYVVKGTKDEFYVVDRHVFHSTYDRLPEDALSQSYRKRMVTVEAMQFKMTIQNIIKGVDFTGQSLLVGRDEAGEVYTSIMTLEGEAKINDGDFIVKELQGECYPVPEAVFKEIYTLKSEENNENEK